MNCEIHNNIKINEFIKWYLRPKKKRINSARDENLSIIIIAKLRRIKKPKSGKKLR